MNKFRQLSQADNQSVIQEALELSEKSHKRALESAIDSAELQKLNARTAINDLYKGVGKGKTLDFNKLLEQRQIIISAEQTIAELKKIEVELFTEETTAKKK